MIKTLIGGGLIISFFVLIFGYPEIISMVLRIKGDFIITLGYFFSKEVILTVFLFGLYEAITKILKHL